MSHNNRRVCLFWGIWLLLAGESISLLLVLQPLGQKGKKSEKNTFILMSRSMTDQNPNLRQLYVCVFNVGPGVEHTSGSVEGEEVVSMDSIPLSVWECVCGTTEVWVSYVFAPSGSLSFSVSRWGGMYPDWGFDCSLWLSGGLVGQRPLLSCPRKPLSLGLQCSRHWRARVERSATRRLSSGLQPRSPSSAPIRRKVRPTWRAGQPQERSRSGTQRDWGPLRTRDVAPVRKTVCTEMENCHQGPERSIPLTCTFSTEHTEWKIVFLLLLFSFNFWLLIVVCIWLIWFHSQNHQIYSLQVYYFHFSV